VTASSIELARGAIAAGHVLTIPLVRDLDTKRETLVLAWPPKPTEIKPSRLTSTTTAIVVVLATARTQLDAIRKAER
jgi:hypothetical protein